MWLWPTATAVSAWLVCVAVVVALLAGHWRSVVSTAATIPLSLCALSLTYLIGPYDLAWWLRTSASAC